MNYSTTSWNLRKAPCGLTVADSLVVDLSGTEQEILDRMKPKTRYNIHLSSRKGVRVVEVDSSSLPEFYDLYLQTARRGRFSALDYAYFSALFEARSPLSISTRLSFYLGVHGREVLAGAVVAVSGRRATYLFGASSNHSRNLMSPYAVHWRAIQDARSRQCIWYDMGGVSPYRDPTHRLHGLFRFKAGFGGHIEHRAGTWDYPLQRERYEELRNGEALRSTF
jgi:lipid II:glycine glycyltransferase (peptidoglycan interpeptide bridge formation enzyme)